MACDMICLNLAKLFTWLIPYPTTQQWSLTSPNALGLPPLFIYVKCGQGMQSFCLGQITPPYPPATRVFPKSTLFPIKHQKKLTVAKQASLC